MLMGGMLDTVAEIRFGSILTVAVVVLLGTALAWWFLASSAATAPIAGEKVAVDRGTSGTGPTVARAAPPPSFPSQEQAQPEASSEVLITRGVNTEVVLPRSPEQAALERRSENYAFSAQVGAFQNPEGARKRLEELTALGYGAFLEPVQGADEAGFRLLIGRFQTYEEASTAVAELKAAGLDAFVRPSEQP
jgi:cell division septation protein DedD